MLEVLLVLSGILILLAVGLYRCPWPAIAFVTVVAAAFYYLIFQFAARSLLLIFPALLIAWALCRWRDLSRAKFAALASVTVAASWGVAAFLFLPRWREIESLVNEFPVVRMDERLAYEQAESLVAQRTFEAITTKDLMYRIEERSPSEPWARNRRRSALISLEMTHGDFVEAFTQQEEFGFFRMYHMPAKREFIALTEPVPLAIPEPPPSSVSGENVDEESSVRYEAGEAGTEFHLEQILNFADPQTYGLPLDGHDHGIGWTPLGAARVRGFEPHAFRALPGGSPAGEEWQLTRLELVSLLKHDPPAAYVSQHLPRMQDLSSDDAPTRPLNAFESRALQQLQDAETIVAEQSRNQIRMLGGLRAAIQCQQCHRVAEGDLLGAFSYEFRRKTPLPAPKGKEPTKPLPPLT